jgi:adenine phosphoribosyltransferase
MKLQEFIRTVKDFPKQGILFRDITPLLKNPEAFNFVINSFSDFGRKNHAQFVVAVESRGFIVGGAVATKLGVGFAPLRKKDKLPYKKISYTYQLEYGKDTIEIHEDAIEKGQNVLVVDDLLATGGTALASCKLVERLGANVCGAAFIIELVSLKGRERIKDYNILTLIRY